MSYGHISFLVHIIALNKLLFLQTSFTSFSFDVKIILFNIEGIKKHRIYIFLQKETVVLNFY